MIRLPLAGLFLLGASAAALASDLPLRTSIPTFEPPPPPVFTWSGAYAGVVVGAAAGGDFRADTYAPMPQAQASASLAGFTAGGTLGYNYQFGPGDGFVVGIEVDGGYADLHNQAAVSVPRYRFSASGGVAGDSYYATVRGRVGYAFGPMLAYATGGWAFSELGVTGGVSVPGFHRSLARSMPIDGYTVGAGVEYAVMPNVSLKAEYLYADLNRVVNQRVDHVPVHLNAGFDAHQIRIGANYRFGGLPGGLGFLGL